MAITQGFELLSSAVTDTFVFNISWLISIVFVFFTLLIITRDTNKWKGLAFPVTILWHVVGITPSFLFYILTGIVFIIDALSINTIGNVISAIVTGTKKVSGNPERTKVKNMMSREYDRRRKKDLKNLPTNYLLDALRGKKK